MPVSLRFRPEARRRAGSNQTRSTGRRIARALLGVFRPESTPAERLMVGTQIASGIFRVEYKPGATASGRHNISRRFTTLSKGVRRGRKLVTLVHELTHALGIGNHAITASALGNYFALGFRARETRRNRKPTVEPRRAGWAARENLDYPEALALLRKRAGNAETEYRAIVPLREGAFTSPARYGAGLGHRMHAIDQRSGKPFAGLVALREVLRRRNTTFAKAEREILDGKHDAAIEEVQRVISGELRRGREKMFEKK